MLFTACSLLVFVWLRRDITVGIHGDTSEGDPTRRQKSTSTSLFSSLELFLIYVGYRGVAVDVMQQQMWPPSQLVLYVKPRIIRVLAVAIPRFVLVEEDGFERIYTCQGALTEGMLCVLSCCRELTEISNHGGGRGCGVGVLPVDVASMSLTCCIGR